MLRRVGSSGLLVLILVAPTRAQTWTTQQVTFAPGGANADGNSAYPVLSDEGRFLLYTSWATNYAVATSGPQIWLLDRETGALDLVSQDSSGVSAQYTPPPSAAAHCEPIDASSDGRFVTFVGNPVGRVPNDTNAAYLDDLFLRDRVAGATETLNRGSGGTTGNQGS